MHCVCLYFLRFPKTKLTSIPPKGGNIAEQARSKMAPATTGLERAVAGVPTLPHSDLREKQAFKQAGCLSARGECQSLVLP